MNDPMTWIGIALVVVTGANTWVGLATKQEMKRLNQDICDLWKHHNSHGHALDCPSEGCKAKTTAVIIHEER